MIYLPQAVLIDYSMFSLELKFFDFSVIERLGECLINVLHMLSNLS